MNDLHTRLTAAVNARLEQARLLDLRDAVPAGTGWYTVESLAGRTDEGGSGLFEDDALFIVANSPEAVIRHCERDLRVLERHRPPGTARGLYCRGCAGGWPCDEIRDLAVVYAVRMEGDR